MKIKNWRVSTWIFTSFVIILSLFIGLGLLTFNQTNQLQNQITTMYNHPLNVRRAIDNIKLAVVNQQIGLRELLTSDSSTDDFNSLAFINQNMLIVDEQFEVIDEYYLGPENDIAELKAAYTAWVTQRDINLDRIENGETDQVLISIHDSGSEGTLRIDLFNKVQVLDLFAQAKADELYENSVKLDRELEVQMTVILIGTFIWIFLIGVSLYRNITNPLKTMNLMLTEFQSGNYSVRLKDIGANEFGRLSNAFNDMANSIEKNDKLHHEVGAFSDVLITSNDIDTFNKFILSTIMEQTNSQIAAFYINRANEFQCIETIGLDEEYVESFSQKSLTGQFAEMFAKKDVTHLILDREDDHFVFNTISNGFVPRELMSIPILINDKITAIISIGTLGRYTDLDFEFVNRILDMLAARFETVIANEKLNEYLAELTQKSDELVEQNAELEMQKKQLDEVSKLKTNFLSNMSHELRTPLNSVIALSGVLSDRLKDQIPDEEYGYIDIIERNGKNLLDLINDILDISRIESGKTEVINEVFDISRVIEDMLEMIQPQVNSKQVSLDYHNKSEELLVYSDLDKVRHILQNLVGNAVKFTSIGSVSVKVRKEKKSIIVDVIDTGIGISEEQMEHIFDEFRQADGSTSRRFGGTGLGLAIAMKYANLLGGTIKVSSELEYGSTFSLVLPVKKEQFNVSTDMKTYQNGVHHINLPKDKMKYDKKVLLVEDNESAIIQIRNLVEGMGIQIDVCNNGEEAIVYLESNRPDGIILDLMMPGIDGFGVLREVRNHDNTFDIPVMVLTAKHLTKEDLKELKRNNVHQLVQKGDIDRILLQKTIFSLLFPQYHNGNKKVLRKKQGNPKILVIEDNKDNMTTIRALLDNYGEMIEAEDGNEGIEKALHSKPDLILLDISLPNISGIDIFHELKENPKTKKIPVIAITASAMRQEREAILSEGFDGFISKPIIKETFYEVIGEVLYGV